MSQQTDQPSCPWKIKWGPGLESTPSNTSQCEKAHHPEHEEHKGPGLPDVPYQKIVWFAGDRREFTGDFVMCPADCVLPIHHHGNHAP